MWGKWKEVTSAASCTCGVANSAAQKAEAMEEKDEALPFQKFMTYYKQLEVQKIDSAIAFELQREVFRAEQLTKLLRKYLPSSISKEIKEEISGNSDFSAKQSQASDIFELLSLITYDAANWMRRFVKDRSKPDFYIEAENEDGQDRVKLVSSYIETAVNQVLTLTDGMVLYHTFLLVQVAWDRERKATMKAASLQTKRTLRKLQSKLEGKKGNLSLPKNDKEIAIVRKMYEEIAGSPAIIDARKRIKEAKEKKAEKASTDGGAKNPSKSSNEKKRLEEEAWNNAGEYIIAVETLFHELGKRERLTPEWRTEGIRSVGPFGIKTVTDIKDIQLEDTKIKNESDIEARIYLKEPSLKDEVSSGQSVYKVDSNGHRYIECKLSPMAKVTISGSYRSRDHIRIPKNAAYFSFVYPANVESEHNSTVFSLLMFGGFVYFGKDKEYLACNTLWTGANLLTSAPKELPKEVVQKLEENNRLHDITLTNLRDKGARRFAWVYPKEFQLSDHGAWVYIYEDEKVNNYFAIDAVDGS